MNLKTAFEKLAAIHGNHSAAAIALGYTPEHYRAIRNGRVNISQRVQNSIIAAATIPTPPPTEPACEARP